MSKVRVPIEVAFAITAAEREEAAKDGAALPDGKFPIRNTKELRSAIRLRHNTDVPYSKVRAHILKRAKALGVKLQAKDLV